jgi:hypothetical protein
METNKKGTHQLALRLISVNVLLGAKNVFTRRCGSERPGPEGSGTIGEEATGYIGGGGGVGELINHPTFQFVESYCVVHPWIFGLGTVSSALRNAPIRVEAVA